MNISSREAVAYGALVFAQFTWALGNIGTSHALSSGGSHMPPLQFAFLRELYASMLMALLAVCKEGLVRPTMSDLPRLLVLGTSGTFLPHVLFLIGLLLTSPNIAAIYTPLVPVVGGVLAVFTRTESYATRLLWLQWGLSISAVVAGALVIIQASSGELNHGSVHHASHGAVHGASLNRTAQIVINSTAANGTEVAAPVELAVADLNEAGWSVSMLVGNVCLLCYVTSFACFLFIQKAFLSKVPPMTLTTWGYSIGMVEMGALALVSGQLTTEAVSTVSFELGAVLAFVVLVGTALNYNLYTWANSVLPASTVSLFHGTNPVFTAFLSHYLLATDIFVAHLAGGMLILLGLCANMRLKSKSTPASTNLDASLKKDGTVLQLAGRSPTVIKSRASILKDF